MMRIEKDNYLMEVDIEKTREYYAARTLCDCLNCRNYYKGIEGRLLLLKEFLDEFGVDITRPDEMGWYDNEEKQEINYTFVAYTVTGKLLQPDKHEIDIWDEGLFLNIKIDEGYVPNEQSEEYFVITVYNIVLPWVLDEPFTSVKEEKKPKKSWFGLLKR